MLHQPLCVHIKSQRNQSTLKVCVNFSCSPKDPFFQKYKSAMPQFFIDDPIFQSFLSWFTFSMKFLRLRCLKLCPAKHISTYYYSQLFL
jgi:hypothetical protein